MQQKVTKYTESEQAQVEERLEAILSSPGFENSVQMSNFLRFIVEKTLQGKTQDLKGYTIGVDALGRPEDFDPQTDPSVRVMAGRLRQALDNFNRDSPGPVSIILEKGNYVPSFGFLGVSEDELQTMEAEDIETASLKSELTGIDMFEGIPEDKEEVSRIDANYHEENPESKANRPATGLRLLALIAAMTATLFVGWQTYTFFAKPQWQSLPEPSQTVFEKASLPSINVRQDFMADDIPGWVKVKKTRSNTMVAFSRFNEFRIIRDSNGSEATTNNSATADYDLHMLYEKEDLGDALEIFITLSKMPQGEVIWSEKLTLDEPQERRVEARNTEKIRAAISEILSPYGILYGDIKNRKDASPRLECIREIYSYFSDENLQAYTNGLECGRQSIAAGNASSSMYALVTFLHVEAYRKRFAGVSDNLLQDAFDLAGEAIRLDPRNARAYQALFAVHKTSGEIEAAQKAAEKAIELNPFDRDIIGDYAAFLIANNEMMTATPYLEETLALTPHPPVWLNFFNFIHADVTGDDARANRIASRLDHTKAPISAIAVILNHEREKSPSRLASAISHLEKLEPSFLEAPQDGLLRRGFDEELADKLASRFLTALQSRKISSVSE
ncbi:MAG: hypothetical protein AAGF54_02235 [Pseudomonadota bacterium]